jgi:MFS family permease
MVRFSNLRHGGCAGFQHPVLPNIDPRTGTLGALGTFTVGFLARPIGGAVFDHFGDRIGRKSMLMLTMIGMGGATALIGVLPTYNRIGFWAPVFCSRCASFRVLPWEANGAARR